MCTNSSQPKSYHTMSYKKNNPSLLVLSNEAIPLVYQRWSVLVENFHTYSINVKSGEPPKTFQGNQQPRFIRTHPSLSKDWQGSTDNYIFIQGGPRGIGQLQQVGTQESEETIIQSISHMTHCI